MNDIIYFLGLLTLGFIGFLIYKTYSNNEIKKFNENALLTIVLTDYFSPIKEILKVKTEHQKNVSIDLNYILLNIIIITDNILYENLKREFSNVYKQYVKNTILEIRKKTETVNGKELINLELEKYRIQIEENLKNKTLLSLKLQQNKVMYQPVLEKVLTSSGSNKIQFLKTLSEELNILPDDLQGTYNDLKHRETGLIYEIDDIITQNYDNVIWDNKKLSNELFVLSNKLSIIKNINLNRI